MWLWVLSCRSIVLTGSILSPPYPPVPLLLGAFSFASYWIVTKCWLMNESSACHFPFADSIFKVKTAGYIKEKKSPEISILLITLWFSWVLSSRYSFIFNYLSCSIHQWILKDIYNEILYQCIQLDMCLCWNRDCCCMDSNQDKMTAYYKYVWLVINYSQRNNLAGVITSSGFLINWKLESVKLVDH